MNLTWRHVPVIYPGKPKVEIFTSLTQAEADELCRLAEGKTVLEIGTACGYSACVMAQTARLVVSVDHHEHLKALSQVRDTLFKLGLQDKVMLVVGNCREALPLLGSRAFDMAFIDGDHTADGVTFDAAQCSRIVRSGGMLAFHDHGEATCPEVGPTLDQLFGPGRLVDTLFLVENK